MFIRWLKMGVIGRAGFAERRAALVRDHCQKQADDLGQEPDSVYRDRFSQHVTAIVIPTTAFTSGAEGVLIETGTIFTGTA